VQPDGLGRRITRGGGLLCSDGLYDVLAVPVIAQAVGELSPAEACQVLIEKALAAGAPDNISTGVFLIETAPPA